MEHELPIKKITLSTLKSFVRKNTGRLLVMEKASFDAMTDCVQRNAPPSFVQAGTVNMDNAHTLGIGIWLVGSSRDCFRPFFGDGLSGIEINNCCGSYVVAVRQ
jgi:hypothetical protein